MAIDLQDTSLLTRINGGDLIALGAKYFELLNYPRNRLCCSSFYCWLFGKHSKTLSLKQMPKHCRRLWLQLKQNMHLSDSNQLNKGSCLINIHYHYSMEYEPPLPLYVGLNVQTQTRSRATCIGSQLSAIGMDSATWDQQTTAICQDKEKKGVLCQSSSTII